MELGARLKQARLEAGLSQRQLCGDTITRNMLSQIENGAARPSMDTLRYLSQRLGKPISYFLEETAVTSPNLGLMEQARKCYGAGDPEKTLETLEGYAGPDPVFDGEYGLLRGLSLMAMAEQAVRENRLPYAKELLEAAGEVRPFYPLPEEKRQRLLYQAGAQAALPDLDDTLLLYAQAALEQKQYTRAMGLLEGMEDREMPRRSLLLGRLYFEKQDYAAAAVHLAKAEAVYGSQCARLLEVCYRELGDYKRAYEYACKQR